MGYNQKMKRFLHPLTRLRTSGGVEEINFLLLESLRWSYTM